MLHFCLYSIWSQTKNSARNFFAVIMEMQTKLWLGQREVVLHYNTLWCQQKELEHNDSPQDNMMLNSKPIALSSICLDEGISLLVM